MVSDLQILLDRAYFPAAIAVLALGAWLTLAGRAWLLKLLGVGLAYGGAAALALAANPSAGLGVALALSALSAATLGLGGAILARVREAFGDSAATDPDAQSGLDPRGDSR